MAVNKQNRLTITQYASAIRRDRKQKQILKGLKLGKIGKIVDVPDNRQFRAMVEKVPHLVKIKE